MNREIRNNTGVGFFTGVRQVDEHAIEITPSDLWLNAPRKDRESSLRMLFTLWVKPTAAVRSPSTSRTRGAINAW